MKAYPEMRKEKIEQFLWHLLSPSVILSPKSNEKCEKSARSFNGPTYVVHFPTMQEEEDGMKIPPLFSIAENEREERRRANDLISCAY